MTAAQLRAALKRLDLSATDAAKRLGVTPHGVWHWLRGDRKIPEPVAILIRTWLKEAR